jgi:hypothetical protein
MVVYNEVQHLVRVAVCLTLNLGQLRCVHCFLERQQWSPSASRCSSTWVKERPRSERTRTLKLFGRLTAQWKTSRRGAVFCRSFFFQASAFNPQRTDFSWKAAVSIQRQPARLLHFLRLFPGRELGVLESSNRRRLQRLPLPMRRRKLDAVAR